MEVQFSYWQYWECTSVCACNWRAKLCHIDVIQIDGACSRGIVKGYIGLPCFHMTIVRWYHYRWHIEELWHCCFQCFYFVASIYCQQTVCNTRSSICRLNFCFVQPGDV